MIMATGLALSIHEQMCVNASSASGEWLLQVPGNPPFSSAIFLLHHLNFLQSLTPIHLL
jgi:hypothetical protein